MTTLSIEGRKVKVDDSFLSLTPEQQEATVEEIAAQMNIKPQQKSGAMSQVNRGIADSVGGLVDFVNPFDGDTFGFSTGSAKDGLSNLMERAGIDVADGETTTMRQGLLRGVGQAAGAMIPATSGAKVLSGAGGMVGKVADSAAASLATRGGAVAEIAAGGASGAAEQAAGNAGAPEWVQNTAAVAAPIAGASALVATGRGAKAVASKTPVGVAVKRTKAALAPYTQSGAREVAIDRMQSLAGGPSRAEELAAQVGNQNPLGLTPAQQTQDPKMMGLERLAADQDPNLRVELEARASQARNTAPQEISAGNAADAQDFFAIRRAEFKTQMQADAEAGLADAQSRLAGVAGKRTETENSLIVSREIENALERSLQQERQLWGAIPKSERVPTQSAKDAAETVMDQTSFAQKADIPQAVRDILSTPETYGRDATVRDMHGLYSELRRQARTAMAGADQNKNKARIANEVAEAVLSDLGATDGATAIGSQINSARAFSSALHDTFDKGAPGRLLKRTLDGDTAIDPELALKRTVGRGGAEAAVTSRQIEQAAGPRSQDAVQDYIRGLFSKRAVSPTGEFKKRDALVFMRDNKELLTRYPELKQDIDGAVNQGETAKQVAERVTGRLKSLADAKRSATQRFIDMPPEKAITAVFDAKNPIQAAGRLANEARKDTSGRAMAGLKGAFSDYLINTASSVKGGQDSLSGDAMLRVLQQPKTKAALSRIYSKAEMNRLNLIAREMAKLNNAGKSAANIGESLSGATANQFIEYPLRVLAANIGAQQGGGGASLQTAQMASSRVKAAINHLASDKASQMIADAVTDPELFRALLTGIKAPKLEKRVMPWLLPYLVGGISGAQE